MPRESGIKRKIKPGHVPTGFLTRKTMHLYYKRIARSLFITKDFKLQLEFLISKNGQRVQVDVFL